MTRLLGGVDPERVVDLRHALLRPHQERAAAVYPDDRAPGARHWLLLDGARPAGCASVYAEPLDEAHGLRFRGMAVAPELRGRGLGRLLVEALQAHARDARTGLWCNARTTAGAFYEAVGLCGHGPVFDLPPLGPHRVYRWRPDEAADGRRAGQA